MKTILVGSELLTQDLDRDLAPELHVLGQINLAHPAGAELLEYPIMRDLIRLHATCFLCLLWLESPKRTRQQRSYDGLLKEPKDQNRHDRRNVQPTERRNHF